MKSEQIDVLFIQPKNIKTEYLNLQGNELPIGLLYLTAFIENKGFNSEVIDLNIRSYNLKDILKKSRPKLVAITAITPEIGGAHEIAEEIKLFNENILTVIGGPHASALPIKTLNDFHCFDYLVYGEGESVLANLIESIKKKKSIKNIKGLVYRHKNRIIKNSAQKEINDLDAIPFPARHKINLSDYRPLPGNYKKLPSTAIITSRGCPYNCKFCNKSIFSRNVRFRSSENVLKEIEYCIKKYKIRDFRFVDDIFTLNNKRLKIICKEIIKRKLNISWNCYSRVDNIDYESLKLMKKAGCYHIKYGIESGSQKVLNSLNKGITLNQAQRAIKLTKKAGIESKSMFIIGLPGETKEDIMKSLDFAEKISSDITTFLIFTPFPGSDFYSLLKKQDKIKNVSWDNYSEHSDYLIKSSISEEDINKMFKKAYRKIYLRPSYIKQRMKKLLNHPKREIKFIYQGLKILRPIFK